jgi:glycerophosphoryl diester phosphodiesterase
MPSLPVVLLVDEESQIQIAVEHGWPVYLDHILLQDHTAGRLQDAGLSVGVWTVNEEAHFNRVLQYRPDVIISDVPLLVRRWLAASGVS